MSLVSLPPGIGLEGFAAIEFGAPPGKRKLAGQVLVFVLTAGLATMFVAARHPHREGMYILFSAPLFLVSVAVLGWLVRSARVRIESEGVHWGWQNLGFRMRRERTRWIRVYPDAVALRPKRGSIWYLSSRDWADFDRMRRVLFDSDLPVERSETSAPWWARLQSYGTFLDGLLVINALAAAIALAVAVLG